MDASGLVEQLWQRIDQRNWPGVRELLHPDIVVDWPATGERIAGPDDFVAVNAKYPAGWTIEIVRTVGSGDDVVAEVRVPHRDLGEFAVASFWSTCDDLLHRGVEYWVTLGAEQPPAWRDSLTTRL